MRLLTMQQGVAAYIRSRLPADWARSAVGLACGGEVAVHHRVPYQLSRMAGDEGAELRRTHTSMDRVHYHR